MNYNIRHLPLNKVKILWFCCHPTCLALAVPLRKKFAPVDNRIFHLPSVVINLIEPNKETDRITTFAGRVFLYALSMTRDPLQPLVEVLCRLERFRGR